MSAPRGNGLDWASYFGLLGTTLLTLLLKYGLAPGILILVMCLAPVLAAPFYFGTRNRAQPASRGEGVAALAWVLLRRLLAFGMAFLLLLYAGHLVLEVAVSSNMLVSLAFTVGCAAFLVYFGVVGSGPDRNRFQDDLELHEENRRRYRWRW